MCAFQLISRSISLNVLILSSLLDTSIISQLLIPTFWSRQFKIIDWFHVFEYRYLWGFACWYISSFSFCSFRLFLNPWYIVFGSVNSKELIVCDFEHWYLWGFACWYLSILTFWSCKLFLSCWNLLFGAVDSFSNADTYFLESINVFGNWDPHAYMKDQKSLFFLSHPTREPTACSE